MSREWRWMKEVCLQPQDVNFIGPHLRRRPVWNVTRSVTGSTTSRQGPHSTANRLNYMKLTTISIKFHFTAPVYEPK